MSEPSGPYRKTSKPAKTLLERLAALISQEPESRAELLGILHEAHDRNLIDAESLAMIEGVFQVSELSARDIMIPRSQMYVIDMTQPVEDWLSVALETQHSRFPAIDGDLDKVVGILLSKDLLRYFTEENFNIHDMLRPVTFVPESKRLNILLRDFRNNHNHMALVIDEYGSVSGLLTIEDILEQIVGDIEDEYDEDEDGDNITLLSPGMYGKRWRVNALTELEQFNETLGTQLEEDSVDTIGGLIVHHFGKVPQKGESCDIEGLHIEILRADAHQLHTLLVEKNDSSVPN